MKDKRVIISKKVENVHKGHRERLRNMFLAGGVDICPEHQILEFYLFSHIPQKDTNPIAHDLINKFGSLSQVFDASYEDLIKVKGMTRSAAAGVALLSRIHKRIVYDWEKRKLVSLKNVGDVREYAVALTANLSVEKCYLICMDADYNVIRSVPMQTGVVNETNIYPREVAELAFRHDAVNLIIIHNHPSGSAAPSKGDVERTMEMIETFPMFNLNLLDHIIVGRGGNDIYHFRDNIEFLRNRARLEHRYTRELNDAFNIWNRS